MQETVQVEVAYMHISSLFFPTQDGSGFIDENELDVLLKDLCEKNKAVIMMIFVSIRGVFKMWL